MRAIAVIVLVGALSGGTAAAQADLTTGEREYLVCAGCHGFEGQGNPSINAPRLAGIDDWYLRRQIENFRDGVRGSVDGDPNGERMATMAKAVATERELMDLVGYIESLPADRTPPATVAGDTARGRERYAVCAACHGADGKGNESLAAPDLTALDDWYVEKQLRLYAEGIRGANPADTYGQQMRALAGTYADEAARRDLAAYIYSLGR